MPSSPSESQDRNLVIFVSELAPLVASNQIIQLTSRHRWLPFIVPLAVFLVIGVLEPSPQSDVEETSLSLAIPYRYYPALYTVRIVLTVATVALFWPCYREFPLQVVIQGDSLFPSSSPVSNVEVHSKLDFSMSAPVTQSRSVGLSI